MIESLDPDLAAHRGAGQDPDPAAGHPGGGRGGVASRSPPASWSASASPGPDRIDHPRGHRRRATAATATSRRSSSRTSCPSRARRCTRRRPARPTSSSGPSPSPGWSSRRRSTSRPRPTSPTTSARCSTPGIDDWGGVSPVTADHVNPERAWPALEHPAGGHRGRGPHPGPPADHLPRVRPRPGPLAATRHAVPGARRRRRRGPGPGPSLVLGRRGPTRRRARSAPFTGSVTGPPRSCRSRRRGARWARCWPGARGQEVGEDEIVTLFSARGPEVRAVAEVADELRAETRRRRGHLRGQPQHQLHQRLHVQVPVLRLLQGPAVAQPPGHARTCSSSTRSPTGCAEAEELGATEVCLQGGIHPNFDGDYYLDVIKAVRAASDTHPHPRLHRPGGHRGGQAARRAAGRRTSTA